MSACRPAYSIVDLGMFNNQARAHRSGNGASGIERVIATCMQLFKHDFILLKKIIISSHHALS